MVKLKLKSREEILINNGFDFDLFKSQNPDLAEKILLAMDEYSEQNSDAIYEIQWKVNEILKPLEDLYRKENPRLDGKFYLPDRSSFYKWIPL